VYLFPTLVAAWRSHHQTKAIFALNLLLGWTVLGWIIVYVWALTAIKRVTVHANPPPRHPLPVRMTRPAQSR
jgi:hypothetical protein